MTIKRMFLEDLDFGACPECAGINLKTGPLKLDGYDIRQEVKCLDCECGWFDTYTITTRTIDRARAPGVIEFYGYRR